MNKLGMAIFGWLLIEESTHFRYFCSMRLLKYSYGVFMFVKVILPVSRDFKSLLCFTFPINDGILDKKESWVLFLF